jgi:hypothetical protein
MSEGLWRRCNPNRKSWPGCDAMMKKGLDNYTYCYTLVRSGVWVHAKQDSETVLGSVQGKVQVRVPCNCVPAKPQDSDKRTPILLNQSHGSLPSSFSSPLLISTFTCSRRFYIARSRVLGRVSFPSVLLRSPIQYLWTGRRVPLSDSQAAYLLVYILGNSYGKPLQQPISGSISIFGITLSCWDTLISPVFERLAR